jgi:hypothetical protein
MSEIKRIATGLIAAAAISGFPSEQAQATGQQPPSITQPAQPKFKKGPNIKTVAPLRGEAALENYIQKNQEKRASLLRPLFNSTFSHLEFSKMYDSHDVVNKRGNMEVYISDIDRFSLIWNLFHESRGETTLAGKLLPLLSVLDRYAHPSFPSDISTVIFRRNQYSWVDEGSFPSMMKDFKGVVPSVRPTLNEFSETDFAQLLECTKIVNAVISENGSFLTIQKTRERILNLIEQETKIKINFPVLFYKRTDWDHNNPQNPNYNKMSENTRSMFRTLEINMLSKGLRPIVIGNHTAYTQ